MRDNLLYFVFNMPGQGKQQVNAVHSSFGWSIIRTLAGHPALSGFEPVMQDEIIADQEERYGRL